MDYTNENGPMIIATVVLAVLFVIFFVILVVVIVKNRKNRSMETVFVTEGSTPGTVQLNSDKPRGRNYLLIIISFITLFLFIGVLVGSIMLASIQETNSQAVLRGVLCCY